MKLNDGKKKKTKKRGVVKKWKGVGKMEFKGVWGPSRRDGGGAKLWRNGRAASRKTNRKMEG